MATVEVKVLGGFAVVVDGERIEGPWRLRKAKTLVKLLALAPDHRIHRDVVIDRLWPDAEMDAGANNLHQALHAARRVLGNERIGLRDEMVVLGPGGDVTVDVDEFMAAAAAAEGTEASLAAALARGPVICYRKTSTRTGPHRTASSWPTGEPASRWS